jgi:hypothetical protein
MKAYINKVGTVAEEKIIINLTGGGISSEILLNTLSINDREIIRNFATNFSYSEFTMTDMPDHIEVELFIKTITINPSVVVLEDSLLTDSSFTIGYFEGLLGSIISAD